MDESIIEYLKKQKISNPIRGINLIKQSIKNMELNLSGLVVFTEAASCEYIYTPIIAAIGGAKKVYAITKDSPYGKKEDIKKDTLLLAKLCGVEDQIEVVFNKEKINKAHIVTNLGFVRPLDKIMIDKMREDAVIPYMCEIWERRAEDVDVTYCKKKNIPVAGTNESFKQLDVFNFSGILGIKMLLDVGIEVYKSKIMVISSDKFGDTICSFLKEMQSEVKRIRLGDKIEEKDLDQVDAIIVAEYTNSQCIVGLKNAMISIDKLKQLAPYTTVIQFSGGCEVKALKRNSINVYPTHQVNNLKMGKTLAYLGAKPVIDLHCAGLKVGEILYKEKNSILMMDKEKYKSLIQRNK